MASTVRLGSGQFTYEVQVGWEKRPPGYTWREAVAVAVENVQVSRISPNTSIVEFELDGGDEFAFVENPPDFPRFTAGRPLADNALPGNVRRAPVAEAYDNMMFWGEDAKMYAPAMLF